MVTNIMQGYACKPGITLINAKYFTIANEKDQ